MKENMKEMVGGCCVCSDERGWPDNPLVYCDGNGCTVAVHQACYGIIAVPTGPWYCRKCESPETKGKVRCDLCPFKSGALKRTDTGGWAHVVCALYIPEVRFGNVTSMEPIVLRLIPPERYNKTCYICQDLGKTNRASAGACMQCNKSGCKQQFHVTCAQSLGLLCEEAGNYLDNVKYCGYCQHHYSKLKKGGNVKTIPPYKPVTHDSQSSDSSGEKEVESSPLATGSGTPANATKNKAPGRKSSHSSSSGKNTPNSSKTSSNATDKKKASPSRRGSSAAADAGGSSKGSTPAPSPQHAADNQGHSTKASGGSTPSATSKIPLPPETATSKSTESVGVISPMSTTVTEMPATVISLASLRQVYPTIPVALMNDTVITLSETHDPKGSKKRKGAVAAPTPAMEYVVGNTPTTSAPPTETNPPSGNWAPGHQMNEVGVEGLEKIIKKAKTDTPDAPSGNFSSSPAPPPPPLPPSKSPASQPSPRHPPSSMPGPSGVNAAPNIRSPSLPHVAPPSGALTRTSPHIFHQPQKQVGLETGAASHSQHSAGGRSNWGGLNVAYEMQDPNKPGVSGVSNVPSTSKDPTPPPPPLNPPAPVRNKKKAAMATSVVSMAGGHQSQTQGNTGQSNSNARRLPPPTPPPIFQETVVDVNPSSPNSERPSKFKSENNAGISCTAPHMLGNELNPESGAAARLQEQLTAELAAHAAGSSVGDTLIPPPLINKATPGASRNTSSAQSLDQLLERQWEQGSQFLMEQAQHFDIASLLSCLHQLRTENVRLEEHVGNLLQRRDHLLAVNARLAIPLTNVAAGPSEPSRSSRENGSQGRQPQPPPARPAETITSERAHQLLIRDVQQKPS